MRRPARLASSWLLAGVLATGVPSRAQDAAPGEGPAPAEVPAPAAETWLDALAEEYWQRLVDESPALRMREGLPVTELPDASYEHARETAAWAQGLLERLVAIDPAAFGAAGDHERWLTHRILHWHARQLVDGLPHFWHRFQVTPYASGAGTLGPIFAEAPLATPEERAGYLALLGQAARLAGQLRDNLLTQRAKGILVPVPEIPLVEAIYRPFAEPPERHAFRVAPERLAGIDAAEASAFAERVADRLRVEVAPAFAALLAVFDEAYRAAAPAEVGLGRYRGGDEAYRYLVSLHTTLDHLTPEAIHARGLAEVARIEAEMAQVRRELGDDRTGAEFHRALRADPRFLASHPGEVAERLMAPIRRIEPLIGAWFAETPAAPYGVERLDPALEAGMTFGYYQWPTPAEPTGRYFFNGSSLGERPQVTAAALIYHELVPGHHFQIALQTENDALSDFRRNAFPTSFVEGWAEYASGLAGEMGLYREPYDRYGRLAMEMFLAARLVVDTGMNALGWTRQEAVEYLRERLLESDTQLATETLRYAVDIPGQALAYKIGALTIQDLRHRAEEALGPRFDVRRFHQAVLGHGAMPLEILSEHVDWWIAREKEPAGEEPVAP